MCHCAVYRIREDIFCLTSYQLSATRWGSFPLLRNASLSLDETLSTHTPLMLPIDLHSHTTNLYQHKGQTLKNDASPRPLISHKLKRNVLFPWTFLLSTFKVCPRIDTSRKKKTSILDGFNHSPTFPLIAEPCMISVSGHIWT